MSTPTTQDAEKDLHTPPFAEARVLLDVMVNSISGIVEATSASHPFDDAEIYEMVVASLPRMFAKPNGAEVAQVAIAAAVTRLVRHRLETSS